VALRFRMRNADLFSFWFSDTGTTAAQGQPINDGFSAGT
jgi:hypothetical protein